ncbi:MAG TPA: tetratricopeptide repeat protein [Stellaceae bacterium]|nr:tetratricopeptide repeat protein [Stellaceae bacterium]
MAAQPGLAQARALAEAGRLAEAEALCHAALAQDLGSVEAWMLLASLALRRGDPLGAESAARRASALAPRAAETAANLILILRELGKTREAGQELETASAPGARSAPEVAELGEKLRQRGALAEAELLLERALAAAPAIPAGWNSLGLLRQMQGNDAAAAACYRRALDVAPNFVPSLTNLGSLEFGRGNFAAALEHHDRALAVAPDYAIGHWNRALVLLTMGDYARAWADYEWRWRIPELLRSAEVRIQERRWRGEDPAGKVLLLQSEQGVGDTIQFVRYAPAIAARGARVVLAVQPSVVSLLRQLRGLEQVAAIDAPLPPFDMQATLPDLPGICRTLLETIPAPQGYLVPDPALAERWKRQLADERRPKVGLVWAGNPRHRDDRNRSLPAEILKSLVAHPGIAWFSLQMGARARDLAGLGAGEVVDLTRDLTDFSETAAALGALDLLISVDTAPIHLAGALGLPGWLLLPEKSDWRWLRGREDTPWYSSLRLFRQSEQGNWTQVIARVREALDARLASSRKS